MTTLTEVRETFACFGAECTVIVSDPSGRERDAAAAVARAKDSLLSWHHQFSRFEADSELSRLNADPRATVPVSPMLRRIVDAAIRAAEQSGGLVDPTLKDEIEAAGYDRHLEPTAPVGVGARDVAARAPASANPDRRHGTIRTDRATGTVTRPPGLGLDINGIAKGVFADELSAILSSQAAFVVDCCGDLRLGGTANTAREIHIASPFDDAATIHTYELTRGAVATSGIARRAWVDQNGTPAHHLLDPATGRPAFTGIVQVTALAPTAAEAETRSKAALLSGPQAAPRYLPHGGVIVLDSGAPQLV